MRLLALFATAIAAVITVALLSRPGEPVAAQPVSTERYSPPAGVVALQGAQATPTPDWGAIEAEAAAKARYYAEQTATAQWQQQATATAYAGATQAAVTLQWAQVAVQQTQSAITTTAQAVQAAQLTAAYNSQSATQTATAAIPAMTATRAAQQVQAERDERWAWAWLIVSIGAFLSVVVAFSWAGVNYVNSLGAKANAEAYKISAQVVPPVIAQQPPAPGLPGYVIVMVNGTMVREDIPALIADAQAAINQQPPTIANVTPRPHMTPAQQALIAFVKDAQRATGDWSAAHIPSDSAMGCAGSRWAAHVATLKALGVVTVQGTGRPAEGQHRTKLVGDWDLGRVLAALENGQLIVPTHTGD